MKVFFKRPLLTAVSVFLFLAGPSVHKANGQACVAPLKQIVLKDGAGKFYVYWKPAITQPVDYKVSVQCTNLPACNFFVFVNPSNVIYMNGGYMGTMIPPLPSPNSTVKVSIFKPNCPNDYQPTMFLTLDVITDDLSISTAICDSDTCKIFINSWTTLKKLTKYANNHCASGVAAASASTVTCVNAPVEVSLRKNAAGKWQIKTLDTVYCDSCYVFNFQITCNDGSVYYVQDRICFNYTGVPCKMSDEEIRESYSLSVSPNPADEETTVEFFLPEAAFINVNLKNALGQTIPLNFQNLQLPAGLNELHLPLDNVGSGIYFLTITAGDQILKAKIVK